MGGWSSWRDVSRTGARWMATIVDVKVGMGCIMVAARVCRSEIDDFILIVVAHYTSLSYDTPYHPV